MMAAEKSLKRVCRMIMLNRDRLLSRGLTQWSAAVADAQRVEDSVLFLLTSTKARALKAGLRQWVDGTLHATKAAKSVQQAMQRTLRLRHR